MATNELRSLHADLKLRYGAKWTEDENSACKRMLEKMLEQYGPERLRKGIEAYIRSEPFFDESKLRDGYIPKSEKKKRELCNRCADSEGFIYVLVDGEKEARAVYCRHLPMAPTMQVMIGVQGINRGTVTATCCDYVDAQKPAKSVQPDSKSKGSGIA